MISFLVSHMNISPYFERESVSDNIINSTMAVNPSEILWAAATAIVMFMCGDLIDSRQVDKVVTRTVILRKGITS